MILIVSFATRQMISQVSDIENNMTKMIETWTDSSTEKIVVLMAKEY